MSLSIVCGDFQPSLEEAFLARLKSHPSGPGRRVAVVSPSRHVSDRLQRLIAEHKLSFLNLRFHTFYSLALELSDDVTVIMDELFHDKLMDRLLKESMNEKRHILFRGLSIAYRSTLHDLIEAGVEPAQFREHFSGLLKNDEDRARLGALLDLEEKYLKKLDEIKVLPIPGLMSRAASEPPEVLSRYVEVLFYGFYDLNSAQADFFSAVVKSCQSTVFYPYRLGHPAYRFSDSFYELKLLVGGAQPVHLPVDHRARALGSSVDCLFDPSRLPPEFPDRDKLKIINVSGSRDELWRVGKEILKLTERPDSPVSFDDIGVVARNLDPYQSLLPELFQEHAIPYRMMAGDPLLRHPAAKMALSLLTLRRRDFPVTTVLDILESPYFRRERYPGRLGGGELIARWKQLIHRLGIHSGWLQWKGKITPWTSKDFELFPAGQSIAREDTAALWAFLEEIHGRLDPASLGSGWASLAEHALRILRDYFDVPGDGVDAKVWQKTMVDLESLKVFDLFDSEAGWDAFLETVEEKLRRAVLEPDANRRGVRVLNAMDARGESFRVLFLIGLKEGVFPRNVREDPLLRDPLRNLLQQPAGYWILPKLAGYDEERLLFYLLVSSASERLYCVYPRSDEAGRAEVPSIYLRELCRVAGQDLDGEENERVPRQPFAKFGTVPLSLLTPKELSLLLTRDRSSPSPIFDPLGLDTAVFMGCLDRISEMNRLGGAGSMDGLIGPPEEFFDRLLRQGLSPTALDSFAACPFQFFSARVLELRDLEEPSEQGDMASWVRGKIYHLILQTFYQRLFVTGYWSKPSSNDDGGTWEGELDRSIAGAFRQFGWQEIGVYPLLWESIRRQMTEHMRRFVAWDMAEIRAGGLIPSHFEQRFSAPAPLGVEGLQFHGQLDRVDVDREGKTYRIIDYKSRRAPEKSYQAPVYLEMMAQSNKLVSKSAEALGLSYYVIEEPAHSVSTEMSKDQRESTLKEISGAVQRMKDGQFPISPDEGQGGHCRYCAFALACRKAHPLTRWRSEKILSEAPAHDS